MAGIGGVNAVPAPVIGRRFAARVGERLLVEYLGQMILRGEAGNGSLAFLQLGKLRGVSFSMFADR
jgi:hypothetical protein